MKKKNRKFKNICQHPLRCLSELSWKSGVGDATPPPAVLLRLYCLNFVQYSLRQQQPYILVKILPSVLFLPQKLDNAALHNSSIPIRDRKVTTFYFKAFRIQDPGIFLIRNLMKMTLYSLHRVTLL